MNSKIVCHFNLLKANNVPGFAIHLLKYWLTHDSIIVQSISCTISLKAVAWFDVRGSDDLILANRSPRINVIWTKCEFTTTRGTVYPSSMFEKKIVFIVPLQMRTVFLGYLPRILRMRRPAHTDKILQRHAINSKLKEIELKERCSRSLLANVLDGDDDYNVYNRTSLFRAKSENVCDENGLPQTPLGDSKSELALILQELRAITRYLERDRDERELNNEWKFLAMVVDRMCLWVFSVYTLVAMGAVVFSAPNLI